MDASTRVLLRPPHPDYEGNRLFSDEVIARKHWYAPLSEMRRRAKERGIEIDTWDLHPLDTADVLYFIDLPDERTELWEARREAPQTAFVLQLWESPLGRPHFLQEANYEDFDAVLTYNSEHCSGEGRFRYFIPIGRTEPVTLSPDFEDRDPLVLVNTNRRPGFFGFRQSGLKGMPGIRRLAWVLSEWDVPWSHAVNPNQGELYTRRRRIARLAEQRFPGVLDIYGQGWDGEPIGWIDKFFPPSSFGNAKGSFDGSKFDLLPRYRFCLAFENMKANVGYITEKLFDCLLSGTVPIYLGDERIDKYIWPECFVDARRFEDNQELLEFAKKCPPDTWQAYRDAGQQYLRSEDIQKFYPDTFCERAFSAIEYATQSP